MPACIASLTITTGALDGVCKAKGISPEEFTTEISDRSVCCVQRDHDGSHFGDVHDHDVGLPGSRPASKRWNSASGNLGTSSVQEV